jgi:hypothetical protein
MKREIALETVGDVGDAACFFGRMQPGRSSRLEPFAAYYVRPDSMNSLLIDLDAYIAVAPINL